MIVGYIPTPGQHIGTILWNVPIPVGFLLHIYRGTYFFFFMLEKFTSQKCTKEIPSHYFVVPGVKFWAAGQFEGSAKCC